jgi:hypothetical protein
MSATGLPSVVKAGQAAGFRHGWRAARQDSAEAGQGRAGFGGAGGAAAGHPARAARLRAGRRKVGWHRRARRCVATRRSGPPRARRGGGGCRRATHLCRDRRTGRTGQVAWKLLRASEDLAAHALVRNATNPRQLLQCGACEPDEGVIVGAVTQPGSLGATPRGAFGLVICTGSLPTKGVDVKWS